MNTKQLSIALVGDAKVGKTELFRYLKEVCSNSNSNSNPNCTTQQVSVTKFKSNVDYPKNDNVVHTFRTEKDNTLEVRSNHTRKYWPTVAPSFETFQIGDTTTTVWDVSGNKEFCRLAYAYEGFRNVDGFVLCYDMTNKESFEHLTMWHQQFVHAREEALRINANKKRKTDMVLKNTLKNTMKNTTANPAAAAIDNIDTKQISNVDQTNIDEEVGIKNLSSASSSSSSCTVPFVVVGTKADHEEGRKVAHGSVAEFCDYTSSGTRFFEMSSRVPGEGAPIIRVFEDLVYRCNTRNEMKRREEQQDGMEKGEEGEEGEEGKKKNLSSISSSERNSGGGCGDCVLS
jgi:GTPase SAR1 family protein